MADTEQKDEESSNTHNSSGSSKESEENIDTIMKFMEQQDKEKDEKNQNNVKCNDSQSKNISRGGEGSASKDAVKADVKSASSVLDMLMSETENKIEAKKEIKTTPKPSPTSGDKGSVALSVGSKVEARDYANVWNAAEILEVDCDEMEVLVHYDSLANKPDEWISVSSSRLRPFSVKSIVRPQTTPVSHIAEKITKEEMPEDKLKPTFAIGERCLARWRDNRRFVATIKQVMENGSYEIVFDDGFAWKCSTSRLYKLKDTGKISDNLSIDTSVHPTASPAHSPILEGVGPSTGTGMTSAALPPYHTHLFDPARDYLGSKKERREMKRKLNIKEIFNIGQKKKKMEKPVQTVKPVKPVTEKKKRPHNRKKQDVSKSVPEAVASIIGTVEQSEAADKISGNKLNTINSTEKENEPKVTEKMSKDESKIAIVDMPEQDSSDLSDPQTTENNMSMETVSEEEAKLVKFDKPDEHKHEEVLDKIKEAINKLEDGLTEIKKVDSPKPQLKLEITKLIVKDHNTKPEIVKEEPVKNEVVNSELLVNTELDMKEEHVENIVNTEETAKENKDEVKASTLKEVVKEELKTKEDSEDKPKKKLSKIKKSKKLRLLQEKKVKKQVEKVKNELQDMKRQIEEMRLAMLKKTEELAAKNQEMPESFLLPGEWCCKWVNGQPVGTVSEMGSDTPVDSNNKPGLPRRSVQVEDKRLPEGWTKHMVRRSLGQSAGKWDVVLVGPDNRRFHTKTDMRNFLENHGESLKRYENALLDFGVHLKLARRMGWYKTTGEETAPPTGIITNMSPLVKRKSIVKKDRKEKKRKLKIKFKKSNSAYSIATDNDPIENLAEPTDMSLYNTELEDGYVFVGSLKVQVVDNLLRCPAEGCFKAFRNNTLIKMHIKHYHRDLRKMLGVTPKVLDLAYARSKSVSKEQQKKRQVPTPKIIKAKLPKLKRPEEPKLEVQGTLSLEPKDDSPKAPRLIPRSLDSPKLRQSLQGNKPVKRPKVLLPVRRPEPEAVDTVVEFDDVKITLPDIPRQLDFEEAITTHTVTKPADLIKEKRTPKMEEDESFAASDFDTRSSCPGSATPDSKIMDKPAETDQSIFDNVENKDANMYMYTETGERIKLERMKREEIINCHCGFREEDGLMVQCELCLCWQHALCHNIQREAEVPEKYTCSICLNPKRGRRSARFLHDQDRLYEGLLPGARASDSLRRSHELSGNLLRVQDALHALRVKYYVATKKNHPKLYLWAKDWEAAEISMTQERLNSDYSDLNIIINNIGKENLPVKDDMRDLHLDLRSLPDDDHKDSLLSLANALSSPGGTSLDLPISTSDLERLAKSVQEQESPRRMIIPQPEAAIDNGVCRERLLRHLTRCQALIDARLDSIEAQVAELESQDPSFEDDETADYFPRTKQTIQMLMRDLDTMEELGIIT
ncbi:PHD finger protein 20-like isoform X2 [Aricia agestis]|nr:PHD finger protein 20-like isoform X2 [Aricia agestis]XP_041973619.1 PHD finger protein 20-like isoform X2 [Aricia agestis]